MTPSRIPSLLALLFLPGLALADDKQKQADEAVLRAANLGTDGPALVEFFVKRTPSEADAQTIRKLITDLGAQRFRVREAATRELISLGPSAVSFLKEAENSTDPEVKDRAKRCLQAIEQSLSPELINAAIRLLALNRPKGGLEALLAYIPHAKNEYIVEEAREALGSLGFTGGKAEAALLAAARSAHPLIRAVVGDAMARRGGDDVKAVVQALTQDKSPAVRLQVALALLDRKKKEAVDVLIALLTDVSAEDVWRVEQGLNLLADDKAPEAMPDTKDATRKKFRESWAAWWKERADKIDLARVTTSGRELGLTTVVILDTAAGRLAGRVYEINKAGQKRWEIKDINYPADAVIVGNDRVLVAEYTGRRLVEYNFKGEQIRVIPLPANASGTLNSVQRLPNGNLFLNLRSQMVELDRDGKVVATYRAPQGIVYAAAKTARGEIVAITRTACVRLNAQGQEIKSFPLGRISVSFTKIDVRPDGGVIVPLYSMNKVVEYDADGKQVWECSAVQRPTSVQRLSNGNTLIGSRLSRTIAEVDRQGKVVWQKTVDGNNLQAVRRR